MREATAEVRCLCFTPDDEKGNLRPAFLAYGGADRVIYLWYTDSIAQVGSSYRRDLVEALEAGRRDEAVELMRRAWDVFRAAITQRREDAP